MQQSESFRSSGQSPARHQSHVPTHGSDSFRTSSVETVERMESNFRRHQREMVRLVDIVGEMTAARLAKYPVISVCSMFMLVIIINAVGFALYPPEIESDFDSFLVTDVESSVQYNAFVAADEARETLSRRLLSINNTQYSAKDLLIAYELNSTLQGGILHPSALLEIHAFEEKIRNSNAWKEICEEAPSETRSLCQPGITGVSYAMPRQYLQTDSDVVPQTLHFDTLGYDNMPLKATLALLEQHGLKELILADLGFDSDSDENPEPLTMRSAFRFTLPCCSMGDSLQKQREGSDAVKERWEKFLQDVLPLLKEGIPEDEDKDEDKRVKLNVWYSGSDVEAHEVKEALFNDLMYGLGSLLAVHVYVLLHTRSFLLCLTGPLISLLSVPTTYVICAILFGQTTVSFASFLSVFLVVGFGADIMFVYTDFWNLSEETGEEDPQRLIWTYGFAAKASLATTATTALSFLANLASAIRALRQFAFFMGLCVMMTWLLITLIYMPLNLVDQRYFSSCKIMPDTRFKLFGRWTRHLRRWRWWYTSITLMLVGTCAGVAFPSLSISDGSASLFPTGHNQNYGQKVMERFVSYTTVLTSSYSAPPLALDVCSPHSAEATSCGMLWCEASASEISDGTPYSTGPQNCSCYDLQTEGSCSGGTVTGTLRAFGPSSLSFSQAQSAAAEHAAYRFGAASTIIHEVRSSLTPKAFLQAWESGETETVPLVEAKFAVSMAATSACEWQIMCYCGGALQCQVPSSAWGTLPPVDFVARRLQDEEPEEEQMELRIEPPWRRLQTAPTERAKVRVAFGLEVPMKVNLLESQDLSSEWSFLETFELRDPWTQRNLYFFVSEMPAELKVERSWCWILDFRDYARSTTGSFPVPANMFDSMALDFTRSGGYATSGTRYIWLIGDEIKAVYFSFDVDISKHEASDKALDLKAKWDDYLENFNFQARPTARGAFHVSALWVSAESMRVLLLTTALTMGILLGLAFAGMLVFTWSLILSLFVVVATAGVVCELAFLMIVLMRWEVGLIEVIAIIYFIGYSVTYSLHIAHKYASGGEDEVADPDHVDFEGDDPASVRFRRTCYSMKCIGGAATGSAITTIGASLFLIFCTLSIFNRLGSMCLAVSVMSLAMALGPLPAALLICGPVRPGRGCCTCIVNWLLELLDADEVVRSRPRE